MDQSAQGQGCQGKLALTRGHLPDAIQYWCADTEISSCLLRKSVTVVGQLLLHGKMNAMGEQKHEAWVVVRDMQYKICLRSFDSRS
jgi:hypothetical protein